MPTNYRIPRGFAVRHPSYQEVYEGQRPTIKDLKAAPYLPVAEIEPRHDDPIVLPAGTWVGVVGSRRTLYAGTGEAIATGSHSNLSGDFDPHSLTDIDRYLVPACGNWYRLDYTSRDLDSTFGTNGNVVDIDSLTTHGARTGSAVTAAGVSDRFVGNSGEGVKPIGIVFEDVYASWLPTAYVNYERQPTVSLLTRDYVVQIPAITPSERAIEPGDMVMVDGFGSSNTDMVWSPATGSWTNRVGHLRRVSSVSPSEMLVAANTGAAAALTGLLSGHLVGFFAAAAARMDEYIVGKCLRKVLFAEYSSASANTAAETSVALDAFKLSTHVSKEFQDAGRVQTVPGMSLQGSGIKGIPAWARKATADANGRFWVLEIHVNAV